MVVDLENLNGLPDSFVQRLGLFRNIVEQFEFLEDYENNDNIHELIIDIDNYCLENKVYGYHYTNAIENDILENGLILRTGKEIRNTFIRRHFSLFTRKEQKQILSAWKEQFDESDIKHRDNHIFFNFTRHALKNSGAELLLNYYGGEQVYFPIYRLPHIERKLREIGEPLILKCVLNPNDINTFIEYPWGKIIVSSYHRIKNSTANTIDQDGYQHVSVNPQNIEIIKYIKSTFANNGL